MRVRNAQSPWNLVQILRSGLDRVKNRFFTVLILRHAGRRFRKLRISYPFVVLIGTVLFALGATGLWAPRLLLQLRSQSVELDRIEQEYDRLRVERDAFDAALADVSGQLSSFEEQARVMADELGLSDLPAAEGGAGGPAAEPVQPQRYWFEEEVRGLRSRTATLDRSFDQLDEAFRDRMGQLAATPNVMPVEGWFSHGYGWRKDPMTGGREFHHGIDIVAPANTEILAPADGVVARAGRFGQLGKSLDIAHGYGYVTRYAHMNEIGVRAGDRVHRGDPLGLVGSTGRSTGAHLHYEVFRDGRRVNPWPYLGQPGR
jgi:murein DD-endopeptidase MepM/ murein hydrolase activator NlpD